jgi:large subunit ribosomal protein L1
MCLSAGGRTIHRTPSRILGPALQVRHKSRGPNAGKMESKATKAAKAAGNRPNQALLALKAKKLLEKKRKKKPKTTYKQYDLTKGEQFALCDAVRYVISFAKPREILLTLCRYIRAFEVGRSPTSVKYDLALKLKTVKSGPVVRNRLRLPHPVKTDIRICVICPPDSKHAELARAAGAALVGEDEIFDAVKDGRIEFDRCLCQTESLAKLNKSGLARILGPRGLMPSEKRGTVIHNPSLLIKDFTSGAEYRERQGVIRMAVGQLGFTPEQLAKNIKTFLDAAKKDMRQLNDKVTKELAEVVLSSTNGPGFSLNGEFRNQKSDLDPRDLSSR